MINRLKTATFLFMLLGAVSSNVKAQSKDMNLALSFGAIVPTGSFSSTHIAGLSAQYAPARHVFGRVKLKKFALTYNAGLAYYLGKKETVSNYPYKYPNYLFIHAFGGVFYKLDKKTEIALTAGPAAGIYNGNTRFNFGSQLDINYYINNKVALGPRMILMKEHGAAALWAGALTATLKL
ncbi:MAG: hypothetical protein ABI688_08200 [Bacteroidota bacterium]